ncbi:MAG TPA: VWA domain-containing protein [Vicinamibacterales bacterium]|jgi:Ca-activated chloride channel family protein|nr:VWA domain-containing protein [Vicinamibacterales bacterium]
MGSHTRSAVSAAGIAIIVSLFVLAVPIRAQRIKVTTQTVPLYVTVTDPQKRLVPDLAQEDFEIFDDQKLQTLTNFDNEPTPITAVVMLDTSGSMTLALDFVKDGAEQFLIRMLPEDRAKVGAFNDKIEFHPESGTPFSENRDQLVRSLKDLDFGYPTRLYDAVDRSIEELKNATGRKVVLVFTDGEDTASKLGAGEVLERARREETMVYSIGLENEYFNGQQRVRTNPDRGLRKLSEETGGGFFILKKKDELGPTFTRVAQELHSQYIMGFTPQSLDGKIHKLEVKVKKPGMTARARRSYLASPLDTTQK